LREISKLQKTYLWTALCAAVSGILAFCVQSEANKVVRSCSYLDPITVDILALMIGFFLLGEGLVDIRRHAESRVLSQSGRIARVSIGVSILVIHAMQFLRK
jgi:hypothetical protein